ncbi:Flp pilus assembly protein CpaB [Candidatus Liberibacter africanus]|nr:Flp pilus assembly protein CpaB [Candidatus Liberibacter africanus]
MKFTRMTGMIVSGIFALLAGIVAMHFVSHHHVQKDEIVSQPSMKFVNVLMAKYNLEMGAMVSSDSLEWVALPEDNVFDGFIDDVHRPNAISELEGLMVRDHIFKGDPIRVERLTSQGNGGVSSLLAKGNRAFSIDISPSSAAGGMIKPNDRVDILMVRSSSERHPKVEVILNNIRVLAIDQNINSESGQVALIGSVATLELTSAQTSVLIGAQQMAAKLSLALRSVADFKGGKDANSNGEAQMVRDIQIIKSGVIFNKDADGVVQ